MSANDNAMTRFLFAILQQKCLKDIDWNKVAHDPILTQEITNGHAARMRYSRFRAAMLGIEPQRRNRTNPNRSRVSKKKKTDPKKDDVCPTSGSGSGIKSETSGPVKHERDTAERADTPASLLLSPRIKEERMFVATPSQSTPSLHHQHHTLASLSDMHFRHNMRLLTPCSDSDVLTTASQGFAHHSPAASDMLHSEAAASSFDFCREPAHTQTSDWPHHTHHHQGGYATGFGLGVVGYGGGEDYSAFCEQQPDHHHGGGGGIVIPDELGVHAAMLEHDGGPDGQAVVKHEEWEARSYH